MAATATAASHQAEQAALVGLLLDDLAEMPLAAVDVFLEPAAALVQEYAAASAELAALWYETERDKAGGRSRFRVPLADPPNDEQVRESLSWATSPLRRAEPDRALARQRVEGSAQRLVTNTGRETIVRAVTSDQYARAWARVPTSVKPCYFCAVNIIRGAIYRTAETAGRNANTRFVGEGEFKFHDNCSCTAVPVFRGQRYEPPSRVGDWDQIYVESTAAASGRGKLQAFRRAYEAANAS